MPRARKRLFIFIALIAVIVTGFGFVFPVLQRAFFYPKPGSLPPVVSETMDQCLARLQATLDQHAPQVAQALQPGLSAAEITALEQKGGFRLSDDLRALYRWHNGMSASSTLGLLGLERFLPLEEIVQGQTVLRQQSAPANLVQRMAYAVFVGHRHSWVPVLTDNAGDGYFYDPERMDAEGAFFHHFAEDGSYLWFPSLRNFLAGLMECYETGAIKVAADGKKLEEDFSRSQKIWARFGRSGQMGGSSGPL